MKDGWPVKDGWDRFVLLAILGSGLLLRVYNLGRESLWYDEIISVRLAHMTTSQIIADRAVNVHPPFYFLVLRGWVGLFGGSEIAVRSLSVLFGLLTIFLTFKVASLLFDKEAGIIGALLVAVSTFQISYSQEARAYSLLALLTLISIYFLLKLLREANLWVSIGYVFSTALLIYTQYYAFFVVIAENLYFASLLLLNKRDSPFHFKKWVFHQLSVILLFAPWTLTFFKQVSTVHRKGVFHSLAVPSLNSLYKTLLSYSGNNKLMAIMIVLSLVSLATYESRRDASPEEGLPLRAPGLLQRIIFTDADKIILLSLWLFVPIVLPFLLSQVSSPIYRSRYTISASLAFYLFVAKGIKNLPNTLTKLIVTNVIVILSLVNLWEYYGKVHKEQWREVANYVEATAGSGDLILFHKGDSQQPFDYYSRRSDLLKRPFPEGNKMVNKKTIKNLAPIIEDRNRVWLILAHSHDPRGLIVKTLGKSYGSAYCRKFREIRVYLYEKRERKQGCSSSKGNLFRTCQVPYQVEQEALVR